MTDTKIWVENTATTRASFQRYTFPKDKDGRVMIDLQIPTEYDYKLMDVEIKKSVIIELRDTVISYLLDLMSGVEMLIRNML